LGVLLEIRGGPAVGKMFAVATGHSVTVGRASGRAEIALPQDTFMSGVHFAVECSVSGCRVQDRKSSNGTFLNGARVQDAMLANGDEIKAGQTVFAVKILSDEKLAALVPPSSAAAPAVAPAVAGGGLLSGEERLSGEAPNANLSGSPAPVVLGSLEQPQHLPAAGGAKSDLQAQAPAPGAVPPAAIAAKEGPAVLSSTTKPPVLGSARSDAKQVGPAVSTGSPEQPVESGRLAAVTIMGWWFPCVPPKWQVQEGLGFQIEEGEFPSSVAVTQELLGGITLAQFVEFQLNMLKSYLRDVSIEPVVPPRVAGAEEMLAVDVHHKTKDGKLLVYRRIYARSGSVVGVLTITALADQVAQVLQSLAVALDGLSFQQR